MRSFDIAAYIFVGLILAACVAYWLLGKPECPPPSPPEITGRGAWKCVAEPLP